MQDMAETADVSLYLYNACVIKIHTLGNTYVPTVYTLCVCVCVFASSY